MANAILDRLSKAETAAEPVAPDQLVAEIADAAAKSQAAGKVSREIQGDILEGMQQDQTVIANAIIATGRQNQIIKQQANVAQMQAEVNINDAYRAGGGKAAFHKLNTRRAATQEEVMVKHEEINEQMETTITGVEFLDGILNTIAATGDRMELAADQKRLAAIDNAVAGTAAATQAATSIEGNLKRTVTVATMAAEQTKIANNATMLASKFKLDAANANAIQVQRVVNATDQQLDQLHKQVQVQNSLNAQAGSAAMEEIRKMQLQAAKDELASRESRADAIIAGRVNLKKPVVAKNIIISDLADDDLAKAYDDDLASGVYGYKGLTTSDAVERALPKGGFDNPEQNKIISQSRDRVAGKGNKDKPTYIAEQTNKLNAKYSKSIEVDDGKNWHNFIGLDALAETDIVKSSALYTEVLSVIPGTIRNHQDVIDSARGAVTAGTISSKQAAQDIVSMFKVQTNLNAQLKDFNGLRMTAPTRYRAVVTFPMAEVVGFLGGAGTAGITDTQIVDLTNITQVEQMLLRLRVADREAIR